MTAASAAAPRPLLAAIRPLLIAGWTIATVRLLLEFVAPGEAMWVGVYFFMPIVLIVHGFRGTFDDLRWPRVALAMFVTALLVWGLPNLVSYTIAQFAGWTHGRFTPNERSAPIAETPGMKLVAGLMLAGGTSIAGSIWMIVCGTLFVWLPGFLRRRRAAPAA